MSLVIYLVFRMKTKCYSMLRIEFVINKDQEMKKGVERGPFCEGSLTLAGSPANS